MKCLQGSAQGEGQQPQLPGGGSARGAAVTGSREVSSGLCPSCSLYVAVVPSPKKGLAVTTGFSGGSDGSDSAHNAEDASWTLGGEDALGKATATRPSIVLNTILTAHMYSAALAL